MLMNRGEGGEIRPVQEELEDSSFGELSAALADGTITRARALKLAGAALLAGTGMMILFQSPAEAGRRRRKQRRKRRRQVTTNPQQVNFGEQPVGTPSQSRSVEVTNNGTEPVTLSPDLGANFSFAPTFDPSVPILPGTSATVPIVFTPTTPGVQTGELTILNADGATVKTVDLTGTGVSPSV